ncbi:hypothetical protein Hypma_000397 [Hypsizygus marmoreus]|uniref:Extracellular membrane protein CFEM domain-containing protein n=1 Tax=Hypsizygus marmoreus TaxID=39966 RepID=A0A369JDB1_HYPMA|nr:hypothetical protein Hypma_000397 [Hypsizygus marmoreus]
MVAFFSLFSRTATLFLACTNVLAKPAPDNTGNSIPALLARDTIDTNHVPAACKTVCEALATTFSACSNNTCTCSDTIVDAIAACFNCGAAIEGDGGPMAKAGQDAIDTLVSDCKAAGIPVKTTKISANEKNGAMRLGDLGSGALGLMGLGALLALA